MAAAADSSSSDDDDDVPLGQLQKKIKVESNDKVDERQRNIVSRGVSSSSADGGGGGGGGRKRPNYKEESDVDDDDDDDDDGDFVSSSSSPPAKKKKKIIKAEKAKKTSTPRVKREDDDYDGGGGDATPSKKSNIAIKAEKSGDGKKSSSKNNGGGDKKKNGGKDRKSSGSSAPPKSSSSSSAAAAAASKAGGGGGGALKAMEKSERISHGMQAHLWWDAPDPPEGCQWSKMEHAGVSFPDPYVPHGVRMKYDGKDVTLDPNEEEAATFFASMDPDGMHLGNPKTAPIFIKNFMSDFKSILGRNHVVQKYELCDFGPIRRHLDEQKLVKKAITDNERKTNKGAKDAAMFKFGYALVDGHLEKVGNYNMEPPGAFRGRGEHPKMGKLKQRVSPEQVMINVSECAPAPRCTVPGRAWGEIRHDPTVQWLCQWTENINGQNKYMQLAAMSSFKGKSDRSKYNKAAKLCGNIDKIRADYKKNLTSKSHENRQLATAMWVIDRLALRVGGEKDTDEEADTVGCCSLRVEHLKFDPNGEGGDNREIELEFLGKDSMLFKQTIDFGSALYTEKNGMGEQVYENFKSFCKKKKSSDDVFSDLTPTILNAHLKGIMEGLTAKVFRTYNASKTLQDELMKTEQSPSWKRMSASEKVVEYNNANREVAILCNHQRSVSKAQEANLEGLGAKLDKLKDQKKVLKKILKKVSSGETGGVPTRKDPAKMAAKVAAALEKAKSMKEKAKTKDEKIAATEADEKAKVLKRELADSKFNDAHLWDNVPKQDQVIKRIQTWGEKIKKMEMNIKHKDDNKEVSLGTSKLNYMDPRISVAFCKRNEVPIEKIFSKTLRDKFNWAMAVPPDWLFNEEVGKQG